VQRKRDLKRFKEAESSQEFWRDAGGGLEKRG